MQAVDPAFQPLIQAFPIMTLTRESLAAFRARTPPVHPCAEDDVIRTDRIAPGSGGAPPVRLYGYRPRDRGDNLPCVYFIHGGGFVSGAALDGEYLYRSLVSELRCALVAVDYRLAPETLFPGAIEDCYSGLATIFKCAAGWGIDSTRIGVMGESAGGGLAAALALLARDRGEYRVTFQHLTYPMLDDRTGTTYQATTFAGEFIWNAQNNRFAWSALLGYEAATAGASPYAAPARATDLVGLPPAFISCGGLDLFVHEDIQYAQRLLCAGVATELHIYPGAIHGFDRVPGSLIYDTAKHASRSALARFLV